MSFHAAGVRWYHAAGLEGGVRHDSRSRYGAPASFYVPHSAVVSHFETALALRTREKGWDESDPPKKWGVALVLIYPCGKAQNSPPGAALKEGESSSESITLCGVEGEDIGTGQDYSAPRSPMLFTFVGGWV